jgi:hypothetical protein
MPTDNTTSAFASHFSHPEFADVIQSECLGPELVSRLSIQVSPSRLDEVV